MLTNLLVSQKDTGFGVILQDCAYTSFSLFCTHNYVTTIVQCDLAKITIFSILYLSRVNMYSYIILWYIKYSYMPAV